MRQDVAVDKAVLTNYSAVEYVYTKAKVELCARWSGTDDYMKSLRLYELLMQCAFSAQRENAPGELVDDLFILSLTLLRKAEEYLYPEKPDPDSRDLLNFV